MPYRSGRRGGHAPGHVRDTFVDAVSAFIDWDGAGDEPTVAYQVRHVPRQITLMEACGLVWNCSDVLPGDLFKAITERFEEWDGDPDDRLKRQTYASAARAIRMFIQELRDEQHETAA